MGAKDISPEVVERMAALVRDLHADHVKHGAHDYVQDFVARTAAIVAELPKPVDPDLIEARRMAADLNQGSTRTEWMAGRWDAGPAVQWHLAGIKRGRELAQDQPS